MTEYSSMMYEIEVDIDGYITKDVSEFSVFRCPFVKTSSFSILTINVQSIIFIGIETECKAHNFLPVKITINQNNMEIGLPNNYGETKTITTKNYIIINVESNEKADFSEAYVNITLYLVNPVLYYLSTTNSYNMILEDKTGLEILKDFESHLISTYGETTFDFIKIGDSQNINDFKYEQILISLNNDLLIPTCILQNYRPFNSFSFYFFDDFVISETNKKDIVGYLINLDDKKQFKPIDCLDIPTEILAGNKYISSDIINDIFNTLDQTNPSKFICGSDLQFKYKKSDTKNEIVNSSTQSSEQFIEPERKIETVIPSLIKKEKPPTEQTILYTSDDIDTATNRLKIVKKQLSEKLEMIMYFYLRDSHLNFFQFGSIYNINPFEEQGHFYTPISLVNIFKRTMGRVPLLNHHLHYQLLKFK